MAIMSGFFNSVVRDGEKDREYDARDMSSLFEGLIMDGVFQSIGNGMLVKAATGMSITVSTGRAWFNRTWTSIDAATPIVLGPSHTILNRIDAVVLEVNHSPAVRSNSIKVIEGAAASTPTRPMMLKSELVNQYPLAYILRPEGSTTVTQGNITNTIGTSECPFVIGVIKTINADQLLAQWTAQWEQMKTEEQTEMDAWMDTSNAAFNTWFGAMQDQIDDNAAAQIAAQLSALGIRVDQLEQTQADFNAFLGVAVTSPQKKRQIFVQMTEPTGAVEGDIWFKA